MTNIWIFVQTPANNNLAKAPEEFLRLKDPRAKARGKFILVAWL